MNRVNGNIRLLVATPLIMKDDLRHCVDITLEILNTYFIRKSDNFLSKPKTNYSSVQHIYLQPILSKMVVDHKPIIKNKKKDLICNIVILFLYYHNSNMGFY